MRYGSFAVYAAQDDSYNNVPFKIANATEK
jgi:hypothetical protein